MKLISPEEFEAEVRRIINDAHKTLIFDDETLHIDLDDLLCETLKSLGYEKGVDLYNEVPKYYA